MNNSQKTLLELIRRSLFETKEEKYCADGIDWNAVYDEALYQSVIGLILDEVPDDVIVSDKKWTQIRDQQLAHYIRYNHAEGQLQKLLDSAEIPFVIIKGSAAAVYYNHPERRMMGDIDFLVPQDMFDKAIQLLAKNGYIRESESHSSRHVGFKKCKISFELHHHYSHEDLDIENYLIEGLKKRTVATIDTQSFPMLPKLANGLVLLDHMKAHLKSGLGLRQVVDWMMYVNRNLSDEFWNDEFGDVVRSKGLAKFAIVTTRMCQLYLGLSEAVTWCKAADESLCEDFLETLFISGNFGKKQGRGNSVETVRTEIHRYGLFKWLQKAGEYNWKAYKKHRWLKPFCWLYQIFRYAGQGFKSGRSYEQLSDDFSRSKNRSKLLESLEI